MVREIQFHINLLRLKKKFKTSVIDSCRISKNAKLGYKTRISRDADIRDIEMGDYSYVNVNTVIASGKIGKFTSNGYSGLNI